jgi:hypothetical protein
MLGIASSQGARALLAMTKKVENIMLKIEITYCAV